jgi:phosphoserine phosphatase
MTILVLQGEGLTASIAQEISEKLKGELKSNTDFSTISSSQAVLPEQLTELRQRYAFDINVIPEQFEPDKAALLVTDMDSTLISIECVDEIADFINAKAEVSAITEAAMRGDIDFETSLRQRVALLKGLDVSVLEQVFEQRLRLNPGAEVMLKGLQQKGIKTALVSGGFTFFTERLKQQLGLDYTLANVLAEKDGKLTGEVAGEICGAQAKADFLLKQCEKLAISPSQVIAMGDGANDLLMMREAGLSIAYHAKPKVQLEAQVVLNHCGLEGVLGMLQ